MHAPQDLLQLLPPGDTTVFFSNVDRLRQGGFLEALRGAKPKQESDYLSFVRETGFDYTRDLQALAGSADGQQVFCAMQGRFDWRRLRGYATKHGGVCERDLCRVETSTRGRWASFRLVQPDVLALSISGDTDGADNVRPGRQPAAAPSSAPLWVRPSHELLANPAQLPLAARIFAISVQSADSLLVSARAAEESGAAFEIEMDAVFRNEPTAETARNQLELDSRMLKLELKREGRTPSPGDLTGLLTGGSFEVTHQHLLGRWPVQKQLLEMLR